MKRVASRVLRRFGLSTSLIDLRDGGRIDDAIRRGKLPLVELSLEDGIGLHHFAFGVKNYHPFERAVRLALAVESSSGLPLVDRIAQHLEDYYKRAQPGTAAGWLGLGDHAPMILRNSPPWAAVFPWQSGSPESWQYMRETGIPKENKVAGQELSISDGWHACGPVAPAKLLIEARRLAALVGSIAEHGLLRHDKRDGDVGATLLRGSTGERWWINFGHHRSAVYAALGLTKIPVRVSTVIEIDEPSTWPQVVNGLYSETDAIGVVKRMFEGTFPESLQTWVAYLDTSPCS